MLIAKEVSPGVFEEVFPGQSFSGLDGALHGWQCVELWSDADLASVGVFKVQPAAMPADPETQVTGYHFERSGDSVVQVLEVQMPAPLTKAKLKEYLAQIRFLKEVNGMFSETYGELLTDRDTRALIAQTIQSIDLGIVTEPINWKAPGGFTPLNRAAFVGIATEVANFVQQTFDKESQVEARIDSGELTTKEQVQAAFAEV